MTKKSTTKRREQCHEFRFLIHDIEVSKLQIFRAVGTDGTDFLHVEL